MKTSTRSLRRSLAAAIFVLAAPAAAGADDLAGARKLEDGTYVVRPMYMTAEMLQDEAKAKKKYAGKPLQFEGKISSKLATKNYVQLNIVVTVQQYGGFRNFWCISFDPDSMSAAEKLEVGDDATLAGIYQPNSQAKFRKSGTEDYQSITRSHHGSHHATLRFDDCVVLTGNPKGELARKVMAAGAE